jgi:PAS domain S-box-containing protein
MAEPRFSSGLFTRLFVLCGSVALLSAAIATLAFHSYRTTLTNDRLAAELAAQAHAIAPLAGARLAAGDAAGASRLLRSFAGLHYVTCVDMVRGGVVVASFPPPGCDLVRARGSDREVPVTTTAGAKLLFRARVDDHLLLAPVRAETALVASLMIGLAAVIFIVLSLSFRRKVLAPLVALRDAMQASTPSNPVRAELLHDDEIGAIVKAYNKLVAAARLFFRRLDRSQKQLAESERRFRELAEVSGDWFFEMDSELRLSFLSDRFFEITGLTPDDVIGRTRKEIAASTNVQGEFDRHVADLEARREFRRFEYELEGGVKPVFVSISGVPVFDEEGNFQGYRGVGSDISEIKQKEHQLAEANRNFGDSISYASSLQLGLLPSPETLGHHLGKTRTIWQPKDLVGGDFYWVGRIGNLDYLVFFDCTGHGVPGAFMTLIVTSVLEAVAVSAPAPPTPARILQLVHDGVCRQLGITADNPGHDGLDCAVVRLNRSEDSLEFAGASIDLFEIATDGTVTRHRGAHTALGYRVHDAELPLTSVTLRTGQNAYVMTTDGMLTQIGEATRRVMGTKRFEEGLADVDGNDPARLVRMVGRILKSWQGREDRRDDVAVIAFRPNDSP